MVKMPDGSYLPGNSRHIHQVISIILFDLITIENIDGCPKLKISVLLGLRNRGFVQGIVMDDGKDIVFLCTQVETRDGLLTGRFLTANCYGPEKVNRLRAILSAPRERYFIIAYGDSRGDRELLSYADEGHYKPFRR